jgi:preprotein translocase subunit SecY
MIPLIFAISVLLFPQFAAQIIAIFSAHWGVTVSNWATAFVNNQLLYGIVYFMLVFLFTYFYTAITFNPEEIAKNLQRSGGFVPGFVPGIRPGENTEKYFGTIVNRITFWGAAFLGFIAILPIIVQRLTGIAVVTISGTAILIVVAVALETMRQIDSQLTVREYEGIE